MQPGQHVKLNWPTANITCCNNPSTYIISAEHQTETIELAYREAGQDHHGQDSVTTTIKLRCTKCNATIKCETALTSDELITETYYDCEIDEEVLLEISPHSIRVSQPMID